MNEENNNDVEEIQNQNQESVQENPIYSNDEGVEVNTSTSTPEQEPEEAVISTTSTGTVIVVDGKEVNYYEKAYEEQLKTNLYLNLILVGLSTILILKWVYGGIKRMFHVTID